MDSPHGSDKHEAISSTISDESCRPVSQQDDLQLVSKVESTNDEKSGFFGAIHEQSFLRIVGLCCDRFPKKPTPNDVANFSSMQVSDFSTGLAADKTVDLAELPASALKKIQPITKKYLQLKTKNMILKRRVRKREEQLERALQELQERDDQRRIADGGTMANANKVADSMIRGKWMELYSLIRKLAYYLAKEVPKRNMDFVMMDRFRESQGWNRLFDAQDDTHRILLLQGYLWMLTRDQIFEPRRAVSISYFLKTAEHKMINRAEEQRTRAPYFQRIARWRAQGSALLDELWECDETLFEDLIEEETERLTPFWSVTSACSSRNGIRMRSQVKGQVMSILECARELDNIMMGSKAIFYMDRAEDLQDSTGQLKFDSETMEAVTSGSPVTDDSLVSYLVSPTLCKAGNADGQNYDSRMVLVKANVVCD